MTPSPSLAFVIPCLNEEQTLPSVLEKINHARAGELAHRPTEVLVADNGSTDASVLIAQQHGARVVHCPERGYGAALRCGIENAASDVVIFADADDTYDLREAPRLVQELDKGYDLVVGSRLRGTIYPGAMPRLHRRLGTPMLNFLINRLHAGGRVRVSDCNSGFRCFRRSAFATWGVRSSGMEFASEMLIKALRSGARISEVPISLRPATTGRRPHLSKWRDGMRHLLQILLHAPALFHHSGLALFALSWIVLFVGLGAGPTRIGFATIFGVHTMVFAMVGTLLGLALWGIGLLVTARAPAKARIYGWLLEVGEGQLFWGIVALVSLAAALLVAILARWALNGFDTLDLERETVVLAALSADGILFAVQLLTARMIKQMAA